MPYLDTEGHATIGHGRNMDAVRFTDEELHFIGKTVQEILDTGISVMHADFLLENDIDRAEINLRRYLPWTADLDDVRYVVLTDMMFNMGPGDRKHGLLSFVNTLRMIQGGRYVDAARHMEQSEWYRQTGQRAKRLVKMMESGKFPPEVLPKAS